jgi:hypothetical protein
MRELQSYEFNQVVGGQLSVGGVVAAGTGGFGGGFAIGAGIGSIGGPAGALVGGLIGGMLGTVNCVYAAFTMAE